MKKALLFLILASLPMHCAKSVKPGRCDCMFGYDKIVHGYTLDDRNAAAKIREKITVPGGTSRFWHSCGKRVHYINWKDRLYLYKVGDLDYRIIVRGSRIFTVSEHDETMNRGLVGDRSITAAWGENHFTIIFKRNDGNRSDYLHEIYFENNDEIGVITRADRNAAVIEPGAAIKNGHDFVIINKAERTYIENSRGKLRTVRSSDCETM